MNVKVLHIDCNKMIREVFRLKLEMTLDCKVFGVSSLSQAIDYLNYNNDVAIIISAHHLPDATSDKLYSYLKKEKPHITFILNSISRQEFINIQAFHNFRFDQSGTSNPPSDEVIFNSSGEENILENVIKIVIGKIKCIQENNTLVTRERDQNDLIKEYCKVGIQYFLRSNVCSCDVFIRLGDNKLIKIINKKELYDGITISKYIKKDIGYLYIPIAEAEFFAEDYEKNLNFFLKDNTLDIEKKIDLQAEAFLYSQERARSIGIDEKVVEQVNACTSSVVEVVSKNKNLFSLIQSMLKKGNYQSEHSLLIAYICGNMALNMSWTSESTIQKMGLAAILHDVLLTQDELAKISNINSNDFKKLDYKNRKIVLDHPFKIAHIVDQEKNMLSDVNEIILTHHELPDGSGFPRGLSSLKISQLSCIFIIAEDFVNNIYFNKFNTELIKKIAVEFKEKYSKGNFRRPLEGFLKSFSIT
ncbi:MAG: HD domain-containing protein [Oligoflexia bacterium]|nr:HD domain-containing protein [Oligoflexia bacterium]